ncbi:MAG TPA: hypothetical protein VLA80_02085 [Actinomycetota bacterium]|nr:hypothetical protein [Actinomycetota bacterium]
MRVVARPAAWLVSSCLALCLVAGLLAAPAAAGKPAGPAPDPAADEQDLSRLRAERVAGNTIPEATDSGISLHGDVRGTLVLENLVAGRGGRSPIEQLSSPAGLAGVRRRYRTATTGRTDA